MNQYPYNYPIVLNDQDFLLYGGRTGTSYDAQRQVAYLLAEEQMTDFLHSFLIPTIVTGTFFWRGNNPIELDYGNVKSIFTVSINSVDWSRGCTMNAITGCFAVRSDKYGYVDIAPLLSCGGCGGIVGTFPYNVQIAYESGLETGTSNNPSIMQGLVLAAQINLNEIDVSLSNESTADAAVESFSNQQYSERRKAGLRFVFGNSPMAQRIALLVKKYRTKVTMGLH